MIIEIVNETSQGTQTVRINDGSAMVDCGFLFVRKFGDAPDATTPAGVVACMKTAKPFKMEALRDRVVISFREPNQFVFSTDYFACDHGDVTLKTFGDK